MIVLVSVCLLAIIGKAEPNRQYDIPLTNSWSKRLVKHPSASTNRLQRAPRHDRLRFFYMGLGKRDGHPVHRNEDVISRDRQDYDDVLKKLKYLIDVNLLNGDAQSEQMPVDDWNEIDLPRMYLSKLTSAQKIGPEAEVDGEQMLFDRVDGNRHATFANANNAVQNTLGDNSDFLNLDYNDAETGTDEEERISSREKKWWAYSRINNLRRKSGRNKHAMSFDPVFYFLGLGKRSTKNATTKHPGH